MEFVASVRNYIVIDSISVHSDTNNHFSVVSISCGSSSRDNNTYLRLGPISSFDSSNENCNYRICQTNNKVCRIRLDFNTFSIQGPELGTTLATAATTATSDGTEIIWHYLPILPYGPEGGIKNTISQPKIAFKILLLQIAKNLVKIMN